MADAEPVDQVMFTAAVDGHPIRFRLIKSVHQDAPPNYFNLSIQSSPSDRAQYLGGRDLTQEELMWALMYSTYVLIKDRHTGTDEGAFDEEERWKGII